MTFEGSGTQFWWRENPSAGKVATGRSKTTIASIQPTYHMQPGLAHSKPALTVSKPDLDTQEKLCQPKILLCLRRVSSMPHPESQVSNVILVFVIPC